MSSSSSISDSNSNSALIAELEEAMRQTVLRTYFPYIPSKNAAIAACLTLVVITLVTLVLPAFTQSWIMLLVPLTTLLMAIGFVFRLLMTYDPERTYFIAMQMLLVIPPLLMAAAMYSALGDLMSALWVPLIFVTADILCVVVQIIGVKGFTSEDPTKVKPGVNILIAGMALAVFFNLLFLLILVAYAKIITTTFAPILVTMLIMAGIVFLVRNIHVLQEIIKFRMDLFDAEAKLTEKTETLFYVIDFGSILAIALFLSIFQCVFK